MRALLWFPMIRLGFANPLSSLFTPAKRHHPGSAYGG